MISHKSSERGLSLLEILVVLAIIGIVAAISVPNIASWSSGRNINNDLGEIRKLIDYAKINSVNERKIYLINHSNFDVQIYETKSVDRTLNCRPYQSSIYQTVSEYPNPTTIVSTMLAKKGNGSNYSHSTSIACFFADGTTSINGDTSNSYASGYELSYKEAKFRINLWLTGFYDVSIYSNNDCPTNKQTYDTDDNIINNWCEKN